MGGPDVIRLCPETTYSESIDIRRDLTIIGAGAGSSVLEPSDELDTVVNVIPNVEASLIGVTLRNALIGVQNNGTCILKRCEITGTGIPDLIVGGPIKNFGALTLDASVVTGNFAFQGGGIHNDGAGTSRPVRLYLRNGSLVANNSAVFGGGICNVRGSVVLEDSTRVTTNVATGISRGGGIYNDEGDVTIEGTSSVTYNISSTTGGGIYNLDGGTVTLRGSSRVAFNSANDEGGGIMNVSPATVEYEGASCVGPNPVGGNCAGTGTNPCPICE